MFSSDSLRRMEANARQAQSASPARGEEHKIRISPCLCSTEKGKNKISPICKLGWKRNMQLALRTGDIFPFHWRTELSARTGWVAKHARREGLERSDWNVIFLVPPPPPPTPFPGARLPIALSFWFWFLPLFGKKRKKGVNLKLPQILRCLVNPKESWTLSILNKNFVT